MKRFIKTVCILAVSAFFLLSCTPKGNVQDDHFVRIEDGIFTINGSPYYFIGTNFWFGSILGSTGEGGNRERLIRELDFFKSIGINNLRVLVGADGENDVSFRVSPTLLKSPGVYNDTIFDGLDFFMAEMAKRNMYAVLYLGNSWEWSGGYSQYLEWTGHGKAPIPGNDGWPVFMEYVKQFIPCDECKQIFKQYAYDVITRTNRYTGVKYIDDPFIMSWQIANEPRAFSDENKDGYEQWLKETAAYFKSLAPNQLISTGSEGSWGSENDMELYKRIHSDPAIDYLTVHIWPKNWSWINPNDIGNTLHIGIKNTDEYLQEHLAFAREVKKPVVVEEFGFPRDNHQYNLQDPTTYRDQYYEFIFKQIVKAAKEKDVFAGSNFWAWGGEARPAADNIFWKKGDDYMGDPGQEEQGLNSVFDTDTTIDLIRTYNEKIINSIK